MDRAPFQGAALRRTSATPDLMQAITHAALAVVEREGFVLSGPPAIREGRGRLERIRHKDDAPDSRAGGVRLYRDSGGRVRLELHDYKRHEGEYLRLVFCRSGAFLPYERAESLILETPIEGGAVAPASFPSPVAIPLQGENPQNPPRRKRVEELWRTSPLCALTHPYLSISKGALLSLALCRSVLPIRMTRSREYGRTLLVPFHIGEELWTVQYIGEDGRKRFAKDAPKKGSAHVIRGLSPFSSGAPVYVCEGWATGAAIALSTRLWVICAGDVGNIGPVLERVRKKKNGERLDLVVCLDNDDKTDGNPGVTKGTEAARAYGARIAHPGRSGDFFDLFRDSGPEAVAARVSVRVVRSGENAEGGPAKPPSNEKRNHGKDYHS